MSYLLPWIVRKWSWDEWFFVGYVVSCTLVAVLNEAFDLRVESWPPHWWLALSRHHTIPWWPMCNYISVSFWRDLGTTMQCPRISSPSASVSSPWMSQYALTDGSTSWVFGHPLRQYWRTRRHCVSSCCAFLYSCNHLLLAGRWETAAIIASSVNSKLSLMLDEVSGRGALESVSAVYISFPGTCLIS